MRIQALFPIENFEFLGKNSLAINLNCHFLKDTSPFYDPFNHKMVFEGIGGIETRKMIMLQSLYCILLTEEFGPQIKAQNDKQILDAVAAQMSYIANCLWFVKDNSCYCPTGIYINGDHERVAVGRRNIFATNSHGVFEFTQFSEDEVLEAISYFNLLASSFSKVYKEVGADIPANDFDYSIGALNYAATGFNRIERAYNILTMSRASPNLMQKVSFYVAVLEALFKSKSNGSKYDATWRPGIFLGGTEDEIKANLDILENAYLIRCSYFHGDDLPVMFRNRATLQKASLEIDSLMRIIFRKVLTDQPPFKETNDPFDTWIAPLEAAHRALREKLYPKKK